MSRFSLFVYSLSLIVIISYAFIQPQARSRAMCQNSMITTTPTDKRSIFIFGLGFVGTALANALVKEGWKVSGTCTNVLKIRNLRNLGIDAYLFDENSGRMIQPEAIADLADCSCVLSTIPPIESGSSSSDLVLREHSTDLKRSALAGKLNWIGYISSTGVYGDRNGAWVDEEVEVRPENLKTKLRAAAESEWQELYLRRYISSFLSTILFLEAIYSYSHVSYRLLYLQWTSCSCVPCCRYIWPWSFCFRYSEQV
jgi:hypothetical protein